MREAPFPRWKSSRLEILQGRQDFLLCRIYRPTVVVLWNVAKSIESWGQSPGLPSKTDSLGIIARFDNVFIGGSGTKRRLYAGCNKPGESVNFGAVPIAILSSLGTKRRLGWPSWVNYGELFASVLRISSGLEQLVAWTLHSGLGIPTFSGQNSGLSETYKESILGVRVRSFWFLDML